MVVAQLTNQRGLREIENTIASDNDLHHAGIRSRVTRTTLAHANERHPHIMTTASKHENSSIGDICLTEKDIAVFDRDAPTTLQFPLSHRIFG